MKLGWHLARVRSFISTYARVLQPPLVANRIPVIRVTLLNFAGAASRGAMIGYVGYFASALQASTPTVVPFMGITLQRDALTVGLLAVGVLVLNAFGAWFSYDAAVVMRRIGRYTHLHYMSEVLNAFQGTRSLELSAARLYDPSDVARQVMRNATQLGLSAETAVRCIQPAAYSAVALAIAMKIDATMTLLLAPLAVGALPIIYLISSKITRGSRSFFQEQVKDYGREIGALVADINQSTVIDRAPMSAKSLAKATHVKGYLQGFDQNQLANEHMTLAMALVRTLVLAGAIALFGIYALHQERSWGQLLAYILALYYLVESVQQFANLVANLNRFYPQVVNYLEFTSRARDWASGVESLSRTSRSFTVRVGTDPLPGSMMSLEIGQRGRYYLHSSLKPTRLNLGHFAKPLEDAGARREFWACADFVSSSHRCIGSTLSDLVLGQGAGDGARHWLRSGLHDMGLAQEIDRLPLGIDTEIDERQWTSLTLQMKAALRLLPAIRSPATVLFVDESAITGLSGEPLEQLWRRAAHKLLFVVTDGMAEVELTDDQLVLVSVAGSLIGIGSGSWYRGLRKTIITMTPPAATVAGVAEDIITSL